MAHLYFRYGAMSCGKSTLLLQVAHNYEEKHCKVLILKPEIDKKENNNISSRLGLKRKVDYLIGENDSILDMINLDYVKCVLVDEVQFLKKEQVIELWTISKLYDIPVICYGLKSNFKGDLFEGSSAVLAYADKIEEMYTICSCGKKARFNARLVNGKYTNVGEEVAIDGIDAEYESLCGDCYFKKVVMKGKVK